MSTVNTPRLQLVKAVPGSGEPVTSGQSLWDNMDKIDALAANPAKVAAAPVKRNTADAVTSGTDLLFETWTGVLKTGHWYEANFSFRFNTSLAPNTTPNSTLAIRLKAGGTVAVGDPAIVSGSPDNVGGGVSRSTYFGGTFDVPSDGTYTLGVSANSGGAGNTLNIIAAGGIDNTGNKRCFWIKDLGEK